eukprot:3941736-Rhodomonas_salina.2
MAESGFKDAGIGLMTGIFTALFTRNSSRYPFLRRFAQGSRLPELAKGSQVERAVWAWSSKWR